MYPTPDFMLIGHFCGSRVRVPSGQMVSGRPEVRMLMDSASMAFALPERRGTGCMPTVWNHLPMTGQCAISALAMNRGRRPRWNRLIIGTKTSYMVTCVAAVMNGPVSGTCSRPHAYTLLRWLSTTDTPLSRRAVAFGFCALISASFGVRGPVGYSLVGSTR